jgi:hypothetical protein
VRSRVKVLFWNGDLPPAHVLVRVELHLLEDRRQVRDRHFTHVVLSVRFPRRSERFQHLQFHGQLRIRVVVHRNGRDVGLLVLPIEVLHLVLLPPVDVDRVLVDQAAARSAGRTRRSPLAVGPCSMITKLSVLAVRSDTCSAGYDSCIQ